MVNAASEAVPPFPSLTLILMFAYASTFAAVGVPERRPLLVSNAAQAGLFVMLNVSVSPLLSAAVGWKLYAAVAFTEVFGAPEIVGATFAAVDTVSAKPGNAAVPPLPSLTLMMMLLVVPTFDEVGVPESFPFAMLKVAQAGLLCTE